MAVVGKLELRGNEGGDGGSINADRDGPAPSRREVPRPPPRASLRRREQSPARSIRSLRFLTEEDVAGERHAPSAAQTPGSAISSAEGSAEGSSIPVAALPHVARPPPGGFAGTRSSTARVVSGHNVPRQVGRSLHTGVRAVERLSPSDADCHQTTPAGGMTENGTSRAKVILGRMTTPRAVG